MHSLPLCLFFFSDTLLDVRGMLVDESTVGTAIKDIPNVWCYEKFPEPSTLLSHNRKFRSSTSRMRHILTARQCRLKQPS